MNTRQKAASMTALLIGAVACSETSTGPTRTLNPSAVSMTVTNEIYNGPSGPPGPLVGGDVELCKKANAAGTFSFSVLVNGIETVADESITLTGPDSVCIVVFNAVATVGGGNADPIPVVITEAPDQPNWTLTSINTIRHLASGINSNGGYDVGNRKADTEDLGNRRVNLWINGDMARTTVFENTFSAPPPPPPQGGEGCTPGYWKQPHHFDSYPAGYTPGMSFNTALGLPGTNLFSDSFTLLQALGANGGGKNALARHAAAAILNAASGGVDYDLTVADVQAAVLAAYNNASQIEAKKNLLANFNEQGCPLN